MDNLSIGINYFNGNKEGLSCINQLIKITKNLSGIKLYFLQFKDDRDVPLFDNVKRIDCLKTRAKDIIPKSNSLKPIVSEMFDGLCETGSDKFFLTNSDILVDQNALDWILFHPEFDSACFSRGEIVDGKKYFFNSFTPLGFDCFIIKNKWWKENRILFKKAPCVYSEPYWDTVYATILKINSKCYFHNKNPLIFHRRHPQRWSMSSLEGKFLSFLADECEYKKIYDLYLRTVVLKRKYVNGLLSKECVNEEIVLEDRIFVQ